MANPKAKKVVVGFETTAGADPSGAGLIPYYFTATDFGIVVKRNTKTDDVIGGDIDSGGEPVGTFNDVGGSLTAPMYYEQMGIALKMIMGVPTTTDAGTAWAATTPYALDAIVQNTTSATLSMKVTTAGTSGATEPDISAANVGDVVNDGTVDYVVTAKMYKHTFNTTKCLPNLFAQSTLANACEGGTDLIDRFNGIKGGKLDINVSPDGDYNFTIDTKGMSHRDSIVDSITEIDETNKVIFPQARIKNAHCTVKIDGTAYSLAKDFSFSLDRGTEATQTLGGGANAGQVDDTKVMLDGSMSSLFNEGIYTKSKNETPVAFIISMADGLNVLDFTVAEAKFEFKTEPKKVGEKYPLNLSWTGYKTLGTEKLKAELTNSVANYN